MTETSALIRIHHLSKHFRASGSHVEALKEINLDIAKGDVFGIIGHSGAGKSTLIRCLAALEKPTSGQIFIEDQDIVQMDPRELRRFRQKIGMIFQHFNLLSSRSVAGNISFPLEVQGYSETDREKRIDEVLELVGLQAKKAVYPAHLSGGQKQRVGIARAISSHPDVLLCDEATSALDPKTTRDILTLLKQLNRELKLTIVLITHEMDVVKQICNKVAVMHRGKIVEVGTISQIFADPQHPTTKQFLQHSTHELPASVLKQATGLLLRLSFKGKEAAEPLISKMIKQFDIDVNILLGWLESIGGLLIGNLTVELKGSDSSLKQALGFLEQHQVHYEVLSS